MLQWSFCDIVKNLMIKFKTSRVYKFMIFEKWVDK